MSVPIEVVIYGLVFVGVLVIVEGIYLTVFGKSISLNSKVNRRLDMLEQGKHRSEVMETLRKEMSQHMQWTNFLCIRCSPPRRRKQRWRFRRCS